VSDDTEPLRVSPQALLAGVVRALREQVLPHVGSNTARGQIWAAIDVLRNLAARIEPASAPLLEEARSAETALRALAAQARDAVPTLATALDAGIAALPAEPVAERVVALRALLRSAFERLDALPSEQGDALRPILGGHLAAQAIRDVARFQGSLLEEISKA
jgi:hypothetical protein